MPLCVLCGEKKKIMRIGLNHMDPRIAAATKDRLAAPLPLFLKDEIRWSRPNTYFFDWMSPADKRRREPTKDEQAAFALRKQRDEVATRRGLLTAFVPLVVGGGVGALLSMLMHEVALPVAAATWLGMTGAGIWWTRQVAPERFLNYEVSLEEMRAAFRLLTLTRAERVYCDTLLLIAAMEPNQEARHAIRQTLGQLNALLEDSRKLERQRQSLLHVLGTHVVGELEKEKETLGKRIEAVSDRVTRQSLEQSLQMVTTRLENARTFEQALVRLNAQQEALVHAFSSAQSALVRMQVAPSAATEQAAQEITETVETMNQQTRSVEKAVEEVMTLRLS